MRAVYTSAEMRAAERAFFQTGFPSIRLMECAAQALCDELIALLGGAGRTCAFACGSGGNGGDGYAAARIFAKRGGRAILLPVCPPQTPDAIENYRLALQSAFACADARALDRMPVPDAWVDCLFGIGLSRPVEVPFAQVIARINQDRERGCKVISADIPSGLHADTGAILGACVRADATVCFQALKRGHILGMGLDVCGVTRVKTLNIPAPCLPKDTMELVETADIPPALPKRPRTAHKNDFGHLLIVAGSRGMAGAAAICAQAALRAGTGLVTVACPESLLPIMQTLAPCAMCLALPEADGALCEGARAPLARAFAGKTAIAAGPGLSLRADAGCVEEILACGLPAVLDADALNLIGANARLKALLSPLHAITPHPGEAARLVGGAPDAVECAQRLRALGCRALVKGAATVICGEKLRVSASGCAGMAKGGSGDALTGIVGALMAQGVSPETALWLGSELHGRAGEIAARRVGEIALSPLDLVQALGEAFSNEGA